MKRKGGTKGAIIYIAMHPEINEFSRKNKEILMRSYLPNPASSA